MQLFHELITHEVTEEHLQQRSPTVDVEGLLKSLRWRLKSFKETHNLKGVQTPYSPHPYIGVFLE